MTPPAEPSGSQPSGSQPSGGKGRGRDDVPAVETTQPQQVIHPNMPPPPGIRRRPAPPPEPPARRRPEVPPPPSFDALAPGSRAPRRPLPSAPPPPPSAFRSPSSPLHNAPPPQSPPPARPRPARGLGGGTAEAPPTLVPGARPAFEAPPTMPPGFAAPAPRNAADPAGGSEPDGGSWPVADAGPAVPDQTSPDQTSPERDGPDGGPGPTGRVGGRAPGRGRRPRVGGRRRLVRIGGQPVVPAFRPVQVGLVAVLAILVAVGFGTFFTGGPVGLATGVLAGVAVAATGLGGLVGARLRRGWLVVLLGLAGALVAGLVVVVVGRPGGGLGVLADYGSAVRDGWARMLTVGLPASPTVALLVLPVLVVWSAAFAAAVLTARGRAMLGPVAPPLLGYVVALLLVAPRRERLLGLTAAFALVALGLVVVRAGALAAEGRVSAREVTSDPTDEATPDPAGPGHGSRRAGAAGRLWLGLPVVALTVLVGIGAAAVLPLARGGDRFDPRDHRHPPVEVATSLNPLVQIKAAHTGTGQKLFTIKLSTVDTDRVRTAVLADFDGAAWTDDGLFERTGGTLPAGDDGPDQPRVPVVQTALDVTVDAPNGPFLPTVGQPRRIADANLAYAFQPETGVLAAADGATSVDQRYRLTAEVPRPTTEQLRAAGPVTGPAMDRYKQLPAGLPASLTNLAAAELSDQPTTYGKLTKLASFLRDPSVFTVDLDARPGHSYGALTRFLVSGDRADLHRGYVEQFATAFAVLARIENIPTRVAVGYLLSQRSSTASGEYDVTTSQAFAWPEVALAGIGWVAFDPTDIGKLRTNPPNPRDDTSTAGGGGQNQPQAETGQAIIQPRLDQTGDLGVTGTGGSGVDVLLVAVLVVVAVAAAVPVGIVGEKSRRRRRRRGRGPAAARVAGAWREARDRLGERGTGRSRALTGAELVAVTRELRGAGVADRLAELAGVVDLALFADDEPDDATARHAWQLVTATTRELRRGDDPRRRLAAALDPRPLLVRR